MIEPGPLVELSDEFDAESVAAACAAVRSFCGWHIAPPVTADIVLDGPGSTTLMIPSLNVTAINTVTVNGTDIDPQKVEWNRAGVMRGPFRTRRLQAITVGLTHGFDECPAEIRAVVMGMARAGVGPARVTSMTAGSFTQVFAKEAAGGAIALSAYDTAILDRYRLPQRS